MRREGMAPDAGGVRTSSSCGAAISACKKALEWTLALGTLSDMRREGVERDAAVYTSDKASEGT